MIEKQRSHKRNQRQEKKQSNGKKKRKLKKSHKRARMSNLQIRPKIKPMKTRQTQITVA